MDRLIADHIVRPRQRAAIKQVGEFIFLERPKHPTKPHVEIDGLRLHRCDGHLIEISSSELRQRVPHGRSLHYFCPQKVIAYIESRQLYR